MPATPAVTITVSQKDLLRYDKALAKLKGKPLYERVDKSLLAIGNKVVAAEARRQFASSRRAPHVKHPGKRLSTSITAKKARQRRMGEVSAVIVKPRTPIAHLVLLGTRAHALGGVRSGKSEFAAFGGHVYRAQSMHHRGSVANPFMDRARVATEDTVARLVARDVFGALR